MEGQRSAGSSGGAGRSQWWRLRQRWRMLGVSEIHPEHEFYHLTSMIKEGIRASVQKTDSDLKAEDVQIHQGFEMHTFAAPVFAKVRRSLDITEEEFTNSLCSSACYLQFVSNSKSKVDFFLTNNKRFFLKTQSEREVRFLLSNLQKYMDHLEKYPHSLLVRFLGVHKIVIPNHLQVFYHDRKFLFDPVSHDCVYSSGLSFQKYFIVMQSVFYPDERIHIRYDIKGCEVGRFTDPEEGGEQIIRVLKDKNFKDHYIELGEQKSWFASQIKADARFLQSLNVLDYSLLLAHQPLHQDELKARRSFADLVLQTKKSVKSDDPPVDSDPSSVPLLDIQTKVVPDPAGCGSESSDHQQAAAEGGDQGTCLQEKAKKTRTDSELREFHEHHGRLLPNVENAFHVIDGTDCRYFVGIIDIFTEYSLKKRLENLLKTILYPGRAFSTVRPTKYSRRFCQWIQDHSK